MSIRGVILAGGKGTRLGELTKVTNKHLLPVGPWPMVYHPLKKLVGAGIKEVLLVSGTEHMGDFVELLGSGRGHGCSLTYRVQDEAGGIAQALGLAEQFCAGHRMAVILGDWQHMPALKTEPGVTEDLEEMQRQVKRCKSIVTGILLSAGEARGEAPSETTVRTFLDELVDEWKTTRMPRVFEYINEFGEDIPIISDEALKQTLCNVLDNALEASPHWVRLNVMRHQDDLVLIISDIGPGFPEEMLENIGKPYQSSKGRPGSGLGLFLVVNVIRTLGGTVAARNIETGAVVTLSLPLKALKLNNNI